MSDELRRAADKRLDKLEDKIDKLETIATKIHTALIGNGVKGLIQRHDELEDLQRKDKSKIHDRIDKIDNTIKKYIYGIGGIAAISVVIGLYNALKSIGVL